MSVLLCYPSIQRHPDGNMKDPPRPEPSQQLAHEIILSVGYVSRGPVAYQRDLLASNRNFLDRASERIKATRKQSYLVRSKSYSACIRKFEIIRRCRPPGETLELKLIIIFREKAQRLHQRGRYATGRPEGGRANWNYEPKSPSPLRTHLCVHPATARYRAVRRIDIAGDFQQIDKDVRNVRQKPLIEVGYL